MGLTGIVAVYAGPVQLQIGGSTGLTSGFVSQTVSPGPAGSVGLQPYVGDIPPGSTSLTGLSGVPAAPAVPNGEVSGGQLLTSNGVTFAMIDSGVSTANQWISTNQSVDTTTDTIQIGIFGVSAAWTMLNDQYGTPNGTNTTVTFNFGNSANVTNGTSLQFTLTNGTEIRDAVDCITGTCPSYSTGLDFVNDYGPTGALNPATGPHVSAFNVWTGSYNTAGSASAYKNTTGDVFLDAQDFSLGSAYSGLYLVNIQIADANTGANTSRDMLSAVTVLGQAPEPSTWLLFAAGLGLVGFFRLRQRSVN